MAKRKVKTEEEELDELVERIWNKREEKRKADEESQISPELRGRKWWKGDAKFTKTKE